MKRAKRFRFVLRGLQAMTVWVHNLDEDAAADGVSRQHLQDSVVVRLLDSGIRALGVANVPEPPGNPWLNVFVDTVKTRDDYFYYVTVRLDEVVKLLRNSVVKTVGTTWESVSTGSTTKEDLPRSIQDAVDELMESFIYDYQVENSQ
ncbi:MAG TPA: hypothetical protein VK463_20840 [Desulfomonilaceae bacterium]|nr:hypothetical protein [Desulfomonilaceae bacterium]